MLKAIIVDDEQLAIDYLANILAETGKIETIATYTNELLALKEIHTLQPDIVFLDIHMPKYQEWNYRKKLRLFFLR